MDGSTRSYEMARRLVAMGHEVTIVTSWRELDGRKYWFTTEEDGIQVLWLPVPYSNHMSYKQRIVSFLKFAWVAARMAATLPADVVFATSTPLTIAMPGVYAARSQKVPLVLEVRDLWPEVPIELKALRNPLLITAARGLERWAYKHSTEVVALAPGMKEGVVAMGVAEHLVSVIPNGADIDQISNVRESEIESLRNDYTWLDSNPLLIYAGAFGHVNDLDFMLTLAEELVDKNPEIKFVAIGDGVRLTEIQERARDKGTLNKNVFLLGKMSKKEVFRWLSIADAHLVFYKGPKAVWKDCVSNKLFDAMASGKPIISNIPGWGPLLAQKFGAGVILDPQNVRESASVLRSCLLNKTWLARAGERSRALAEERFSRDKLAAQLEQRRRAWRGQDSLSPTR